jgi:hypothetical protein
MILGIPVALWGIIKLFKKDKERQEEIKSLASLAGSQAKMIEKISEQVEIERSSHLHSIKPFFIRKDKYRGTKRKFWCELVNSGYRAIIKGFFIDYFFNVELFFKGDINKFLEQNETITIWGECSTDNYLKDANYCIYILFEDIEHHQYHQKFMKLSDGHYILDPVLYQGRFEDTITRTITHEPSHH